MDEMADVVDLDNNVIGQERRSVIHRDGLYHRSVNVFVFNSQDEIYLQRRSAKKDICPGYLDLSVAESLIAGEDYARAAMRGLKEELGIKALVVRIREPHLQKHVYNVNGEEMKDFEINETYKVRYDGEVNPNPEEVEEGLFVIPFLIRVKIERKREAFTPWFLDEWNFLEKQGLV